MEKNMALHEVLKNTVNIMERTLWYIDNPVITPPSLQYTVRDKRVQDAKKQDRHKVCEAGTMPDPSKPVGGDDNDFCFNRSLQCFLQAK